MAELNLINFLKEREEQIRDLDLTKENVQFIIDFGLDVKNELKALKISPGRDFMQSIDLFQNLLGEEFKEDDEKFFNESKKDLLMDISLLISKIERI